jgi:hypothetical protein
MTHVETIVFDIPLDSIVKTHEDLANLQNQLIDEYMLNPSISLIYNINHILEDEDGIEDNTRFVYEENTVKGKNPSGNNAHKMY